VQDTQRQPEERWRRQLLGGAGGRQPDMGRYWAEEAKNGYASRELKTGTGVGCWAEMRHGSQFLFNRFEFKSNTFSNSTKFKPSPKLKFETLESK
jgi:hypothetical protein